LTRDFIGFLDSVYDLDADEATWLRGVARAARRGFGFATNGAYALRYDASDPRAFAISSFEDDGMAPRLAEHFRVDVAGFYAARPQLVTAMFQRTASGSARATAGVGRTTVWRGLGSMGVVDVVGINGLNPHGRGVHVGVATPALHQFSRAETTVWRRLSAHLAAGERLRNRLGRLTAAQVVDSADAVLTTSGKVLHATGESKLAQAREALHAAVIGIGRARGSLRRRDPDKSVEQWRALADARWSLIEHFEKDGKHYLLAQRNDPSTAPIEVLSDRERQVVALVALGQTNKLVAYELGIASSTVSVLLGRACRKLGVRTRDGVIAAYARWASPRPKP
jgi:DNA-binding CsgD family transcriptional regulator